MENIDFKTMNELWNSNILKAADASIKAIASPNVTWHPLDFSGTVGAFNWFWNQAGNLNQNTWGQFNNIFAFFKGENVDFLQTDGSSMTTGLGQTYTNMTFTLSEQQQQEMNKIIRDNGPLINEMVSAYKISVDPIQGSQAEQIREINRTVLTWGKPGLTLSDLRNSNRPNELLPNAPLGTEGFIALFIRYLIASAKLISFQNRQSTSMNILRKMQNILLPNSPITQSTPGYIRSVDSNGQQFFNPSIQFRPNPTQIQAGLDNKKSKFSTRLHIVSEGSNIYNVSSEQGSTSTRGSVCSMTNVETSQKHDLLSVVSGVTECTVEFEYTGVTMVNIDPESFDPNRSVGWWEPNFIRQAVNFNKDDGGFSFISNPPFNYKNGGNFAVLSSVFISRFPRVSIIYNSSNLSEFKEVFSSSSRWVTSFFGIPTSGGSRSVYKSTVSKVSAGQQIKVEFAPPIENTTNNLDLSAYILGATVVSPGGN